MVKEITIFLKYNSVPTDKMEFSYLDLFTDHYDMEQSPELCVVATCTELRTRLHAHA